jgi:cephalosporin hydroxylase
VYPLWDKVIAPVLRAAGARRVVEIGALQGETTVKLLDLLGPESEVHVIDPVPQFDPSAHERRFPGRYHFHRAISHDVLPQLPPVDAALIDGDHNWYTVFNELKLLAATAREAGAPLPVCFLHDVGWPYGRRDLYYAPERIPDEFRQPWARRGIVPGKQELSDNGGLNAQFANAVQEGGPRNGVLTALEDFVAADANPMRVVTLPVQFGLAIAADRERIESEPRLGAALDELESPEGRRRQAELIEELRVRRLTGTATRSPADPSERTARRYLDVVKGALLDEHYLENEVRLEYLRQCALNGTKPDALKLRDPRMWATRDLNRLQRERRTGIAVRELDDRPFYPFTTIGRTGLDHLERCLDAIRTEHIPGDLAACGVWRGGSAIFIRAYLDAYELDERDVWIADTFTGPAEPGEGENPAGKRTRFSGLVADLNQVRIGFDRFGLFDDRLRFLQGAYEQTLPDARIDELALLHLGDDDEESCATALRLLYDRVAPGGIVAAEHYDAEGCRAAVDGFRTRSGIKSSLDRADWTGISWRKPAEESASTHAARPAAVTAGGANRAPLARPAPERSVDLSVVVVFHNMRREAHRTLHSLSRAYQEDVEGLDYEVLVVENGSDEDQLLGEGFVRGFGPEFRYIDLGPESTPSPAPALNRGIAASRGEAVCLMIDGAHVLTPGILRFAAAGLSTYAPAIVTTHQWYLGPGQQGEAIDAGYDQEYEDRLFAEINWPVDGYRLFEIGNFIGERDWFDGLWESNCLFVPRRLLEQVGGLDESFSMPGGGYANLDLFERLGATPGLTVVGLLGEGSFHQLHGGTTTNQPDIGERHARLMHYRDHYERLRKRPFRGPGKPRHFVGRLAGPALRTRPRWAKRKVFSDAQDVDADGFPRRPIPVPEQLQGEMTEAFWRSLAWRDVTWLGDRVERAPTDLVAYQELLAEVRPDWIVAVGTGDGAARFFASICDLLECGRVISIDAEEAARPRHPRVTWIDGPPAQKKTRERVVEATGDDPHGLLVIASGSAGEVSRAFRAYSPLVGVGSYAILEGTIINGHPVLPGHGPGPTEAITMLLKNRTDFVPDHRPERFGFTFNPRGFLKRVSR